MTNPLPIMNKLSKENLTADELTRKRLQQKMYHDSLMQQMVAFA